ncbi:TlpA family protein disulfide reductase [Granulicella arctica]|uniref:Peroxiredoxin n=1 Tax=Granulicella arctica TaxID=940613 RepID=A0A7Y9PFH6_9BACT|nr:TlpA disulfide reductase family protein [Granulicella arctica]NYF78934.1 peroxiredoxin [Granulicella arctica]
MVFFGMQKLKRMAIALTIASSFGVLTSEVAHAQQNVHAVIVAKADRKPAPHFDLVAADGKTVQVSNYRGKVVLLNFWATKCGGCILEIPSFMELQQTYGKNGFTAVGISADIPYEGLKSPDEAWGLVRPFMASHKLNYPILMGDDKVVDAYGFPSYPATYLIDRSGKIAATYVGVVSKDDVEANIKILLAEH